MCFDKLSSQWLTPMVEPSIVKAIKAAEALNANNTVEPQTTAPQFYMRYNLHNNN